jgi:hypothetical protein
MPPRAAAPFFALRDACAGAPHKKRPAQEAGLVFLAGAGSHHRPAKLN